MAVNCRSGKRLTRTVVRRMCAKDIDFSAQQIGRKFLQDIPRSDVQDGGTNFGSRWIRRGYSLNLLGTSAFSSSVRNNTDGQTADVACDTDVKVQRNFRVEY